MVPLPMIVNNVSERDEKISRVCRSYIGSIFYSCAHCSQMRKEAKIVPSDHQHIIETLNPHSQFSVIIMYEQLQVLANSEKITYITSFLVFSRLYPSIIEIEA